MKIMMLSGDKSLAAGRRGPFYYMLFELSKYCERIDILCPKIPNLKIQNPNSKPQTFFDNVFVYPGKRTKIRQIFYLSTRGRRLWDKHHHNIILIHEYPPFYNSLGARLLAKKIRAKFVIEIHHIIGYPRAADWKEKFNFWLSKKIIPWDCSRFDAVRVVNKKQVPEFLKSLGVDERKIHYASSMYIDLDVFRPMDLPKKYDLVFAGRLVKNKNLGMLINAVKSLKSKVKNQVQSPKLAIVGDGPLRVSLEAQVQELGIEENVDFLGWLPSAEDVAKVYNQSRIFVMPSLNEGGPRVCLEAMACGVPVVTTRVGVMLDVIRDGENGMFCDWEAEDLADKIQDTRNKIQISEMLGQQARETARRFERKAMIGELAREYQKIVTGS